MIIVNVETALNIIMYIVYPIIHNYNIETCYLRYLYTLNYESLVIYFNCLHFVIFACKKKINLL